MNARPALPVGRIPLPNGWSVDPEAGVVYGPRYAWNRAGNATDYVQIEVNGRLRPAHRIIWEAVHGPIPEGLCINHLNGIRSDNRIANLEVVTQKENMAHAVRTGLQVILRGSDNGRARLTEEQVMEARLSRLKTAVLARKFGVSRPALSKARLGRTWAHLLMPAREEQK
jgi:hypothetical protein